MSLLLLLAKWLQLASVWHQIVQRPSLFLFVIATLLFLTSACLERLARRRQKLAPLSASRVSILKGELS